MTTEREPVRLLLVRHGEQERDGDDGPLTSTGAAQARAVAQALGVAAEDRLVSSTLRRAVETARATGREPERSAGLDEFRFGPAWTWEQTDDREDLTLWRPEHDGGGETLRDFQTRVEAALGGLVAVRPAGRLVLVVHSGVIDAVFRWAFGAGPDTPWTTEVTVPHASVSELHHWPDGRHAAGAPRQTLVVRVGDVAHLPPGLVSGV